MFIADTGNNCIRKITASTGIIDSIAGTSSGGYSGDNGPATSAVLNGPQGVDVDASGIQDYTAIVYHMPSYSILPGNVYVSDSYNNRIRKIAISTGIITTIAGTGASSYSGDDGDATSATFYRPYSIAVDAAGIHATISPPLIVLSLHLSS